MFETFGECPHVVGTLGAALIRGLQGVREDGTPDLSNRTRVAATFKHFVAYSAPRDGHDRTECWVPERQMREYFLPPFEDALRAQVATGMLTYADVNGVPMTANAPWTIDLLRGAMGFNGTLVTDYNEVENLHSWHHVAPTSAAAALLALTSSSTDVAMVPEIAGVESWFRAVVRAVEEGTLPRARIDGACARVLQLKKKLGLVKSYADLAARATKSGATKSKSKSKPFSPATEDTIAPGAKRPPRSPGRDEEKAAEEENKSSSTMKGKDRTPEERAQMDSVGCASDQAVALQMAVESMVLLQNDGTLPIQLIHTALAPATTTSSQRLRNGGNIRRILVVGPTGDSLVRQTGGWTHHWQGAGSEEEFAPGVGATFFGGMRDLVARTRPDVEVVYESGVNVDGSFSPGQLESALEAARAADLVIVCLGEETYAEKPGDIASLSLPWGQQHLANQLAALPKREDSGADGGAPAPAAAAAASNSTRGDSSSSSSERQQHNKKVILILAEGRPRTLESLQLPSMRAVVHVGLPGPQGGLALAQLILGVSGFSGKMPLSYPRATGEAPGQYWKKWSALSGPGPLWSFGQGLSYTTFVYSDLQLSRYEGDLALAQPPSAGPNDTINVTVRVRNTGKLDGQESVLLFLSDTYRTVSPELRRLRAFRKVSLRAGESAMVSFVLRWHDLSFIGLDLRRRTEAGEFVVSVGPLSATFNLTVGRVLGGKEGEGGEGEQRQRQGKGSSAQGFDLGLGDAARARVDRWWGLVREESQRQEQEVEEYRSASEAAAAAAAAAPVSATKNRKASDADDSSSSSSAAAAASSSAGSEGANGSTAAAADDSNDTADSEPAETRGGRAAAGRAGASSSPSSFATVFLCAMSAIVGGVLMYGALRWSGALGGGSISAGSSRGGHGGSDSAVDAVETDRFLSSNRAFSGSLQHDGRPSSYQSI